MDAQTATLVGLAILALLVIFAVVRYRGKAKFEVKGPGGLGASFEGENQQAPSVQPAATRPGISMEGVKSRAGGVHAEDRPGQGISMKDVDAHGDVQAISGDSAPKA